MQKTPGKRGRPRKKVETWDDTRLVDDDEDYIDETPIKKSRRLAQSSWTELRAACQKILNELMRNKLAWPFNQPVDPVQLNIPDYFDKIKYPMDFGTIKRKLDDFEYQNITQFAEDVRLVFNNCWTYNPPESDIYYMASTLSTLFEKRFKSVETNGVRRKIKKIALDDEYSDEPRTQDEEITQMQVVIHELKNEHQKLLNELSKLVKKTNGSSTPKAAATPKPKRKRQPRIKIPKEEFGFKQKERLSFKIGKLSPDNLQKMVDYMGSELVDPQKQSTELVIDLEILSVQTLKKLDQFVDNCLKEQGVNIDDIPSTTTTKTEDDSSDSDSSSSSDSSDSESENDKTNAPNGKPNEVSA